MQRNDADGSGWQFIAQRESAARLLDTLLALDSETPYTKTEIAETAGIPLKTLYLSDVLEECADLDALRRVDDEGGEARYVVNEESDLLEAAAGFDDAYRDQHD